MVPILVDDKVNFPGFHPLLIATLDHRSHVGLFELLVYGTYKGRHWHAALQDAFNR